MALDYADLAALTNDMEFRGRVKIACLTFAQYILDEAPSVPGHNSRYRWAQNVWQMPDSVAQQVVQPVVKEPQVVQDGKNVTDPNLQVAVETVVNKSI